MGSGEKMDYEYMSLMAELGEGPPPPQGTVPSPAAICFHFVNLSPRIVVDLTLGSWTLDSPSNSNEKSDFFVCLRKLLSHESKTLLQREHPAFCSYFGGFCVSWRFLLVFYNFL
jgi:hypothetical protein